MENPEDLIKIKEKLDTLFTNVERELLQAILKELGEHRKTTDNLVGLTERIEATDFSGEQKQWFVNLIEAVKAVKLQLPDVLKVDVQNPPPAPVEIPKTVKISNFPQVEPPLKEVRVSNLEEIKIPEEVSVKRPDWLEQLSKVDILDSLIAFLLAVNKSNGVKVDLDQYKKVDNPLAVRLTNGKQFYQAIANIVAGSSAAFPFITPTGTAKEALVDTEGHQQIDVLTMPPVTVTIPAGDLEVGAVEIKDHDGDTRANVGANGLEVEVKASALPSGGATSANQTNGTQQTKIKETEPTDTDTKLNPSLVLTYDGENQVTQIDMTIGAVTYRQTITWVANVATAVSAWTIV